MARRSGLSIDARRGEPIHRQIFDQIAARVRDGAYPRGHRLPPSRALAEELGTNRNTVVRAYDDLAAAGFITTTRHGTFVLDVAREAPAPSIASLPARLPWASLLSRAAEKELFEPFDRLQAPYTSEPERYINLARLQPAAELMPDRLLKRCAEHVLSTLGPRALGYGPREGLPRLRELIAQDLARQGVPATVEQILITNGSQQALDLVARVLVNPGDRFLVDASTYAGVTNALRAVGARIVGVPGDDQGPSLEFLRRVQSAGAKGLYLMPTCHNPTSISLSEERRAELIAWSHEAGVPLVEDDWGSDLNLEDAPMPPALRALDGDVLYLGTFSKKLAPALRLGFLVCPAPAREAMVSMKHALDLGSGAYVQHVLAEFLERGYMRAHVGHVVPEYRARRDALEAALREHLPKGSSWAHPRHGLILWLPLGSARLAERAHDEARKRGLLVTPSTVFAASSEARHGLRLTYCGEPIARLQDGAKRLGEALRAIGD